MTSPATRLEGHHGNVVGHRLVLARDASLHRDRRSLRTSGSRKTSAFASNNLVASLKLADEVVRLVGVRLWVGQDVRGHLPRATRAVQGSAYLADIREVDVRDLAQAQRIVQNAGLDAQQRSVEILRLASKVRFAPGARLAW